MWVSLIVVLIYYAVCGVHSFWGCWYSSCAVHIGAVLFILWFLLWLSHCVVIFYSLVCWWYSSWCWYRGVVPWFFSLSYYALSLTSPYFYCNSTMTYYHDLFLIITYHDVTMILQWISMTLPYLTCFWDILQKQLIEHESSFSFRRTPPIWISNLSGYRKGFW